MPTKKHPKRRRIAQHKWKGRKPFEAKSASKQLPDTSGIPWFNDGLPPSTRKADRGA